MDTPERGLRGDPDVPRGQTDRTRDPQSAPPAHPLSVQWRQEVGYERRTRERSTFASDQWCDAKLACADQLDAFVVPSAPPDQWLVDALNGLIGLIQLLPDAQRRHLIASHRYLDALTASNRAASALPLPPESGA